MQSWRSSRLILEVVLDIPTLWFWGYTVYLQQIEETGSSENPGGWNIVGSHSFREQPFLMHQKHLLNHGININHNSVMERKWWKATAAVKPQEFSVITRKRSKPNCYPMKEQKTLSENKNQVCHSGILLKFRTTNLIHRAEIRNSDLMCLFSIHPKNHWTLQGLWMCFSQGSPDISSPHQWLEIPWFLGSATPSNEFSHGFLGGSKAHQTEPMVSLVAPVNSSAPVGHSARSTHTSWDSKCYAMGLDVSLYSSNHMQIWHKYIYIYV